MKVLIHVTFLSSLFIPDKTELNRLFFQCTELWLKCYFQLLISVRPKKKTWLAYKWVCSLWEVFSVLVCSALILVSLQFLTDWSQMHFKLLLNDFQDNWTNAFRDMLFWFGQTSRSFTESPSWSNKPKEERKKKAAGSHNHINAHLAFPSNERKKPSL